MAEAKKDVKQPEDHKPKVDKPKVEKVDVEVIEGEGDDQKKRLVPARRVTVQGLSVTVTDEAVDDFEFLDDLRALNDTNDPSRMPSMLRRMVGDDYRRVMESLRDPKTGRVSIEAGSTFVLALIEALNPS